MAWQLSGSWIEFCSCKMYCPCNFGPAEPDQGWCSGSLMFSIDRGSADGVDLSGTKVVLSGQLPGDFLGGFDLARLYLDETASPDQREQLEAIFSGKQGGPWEAVAASIKQWLPSQVVKIEIDTGDKPSFKVGDVGAGTLERMKNGEGKQSVVIAAPLSSAFAADTQELASAAGIGWKDPDLRQWESLGYAAIVPFDWSF